MSTNLFTQTGIAVALRSLARVATGDPDPDLAIRWAVKHGFLVVHERQLALTNAGGAMVHAWWKAFDAGRKLRRAEVIRLQNEHGA